VEANSKERGEGSKTMMSLKEKAKTLNEQNMSDFIWRGECVRCRHIWFSDEEPKKCPKCGFTHAIMKDKLEREKFGKVKP